MFEVEVQYTVQATMLVEARNSEEAQKLVSQGPAANGIFTGHAAYVPETFEVMEVHRKRSEC